MATILHEGKPLPTLKNGKNGFFVLLNGEDAAGGYVVISNKEYDEKRKEYIEKLTLKDIKSLCDEVLSQKRKEIVKELEKLSRRRQSGFSMILGDMRVLEWLRKNKPSRYNDEYNFTLFHAYDKEDVEEARKTVAQIDKNVEAQIDLLKEEVEKYIEEDVWTAAQLVGLEKGMFSFDLKKENEGFKLLPKLIALGKNYIYAIMLLKKSNRL